MSTNFPYKVLNHNEIEPPKIHPGNPENIDSFLCLPTIQITEKNIFIKTKLFIYSKELDQTLEINEVTPFARWHGIPYPEKKEDEGHADFISELYLVHQTLMNFDLLNKQQNHPDQYGKYIWDPLNKFHIEAMIDKFEYL